MPSLLASEKGSVTIQGFGSDQRKPQAKTRDRNDVMSGKQAILPPFPGATDLWGVLDFLACTGFSVVGDEDVWIGLDGIVIGLSQKIPGAAPLDASFGVSM